MSFAQRLGERVGVAWSSIGQSVRENTPVSRRNVLVGGGAAMLLAGEVLSLASCGNKLPAYSQDQINDGIPNSDYEKGLERLTDPIQRSMVIIEGKNSDGVSLGHGVIIADDPTDPNSPLSVVTAYHVPVDMQGQHVSMLVSGVGRIDLRNAKFSLLQGDKDPLADPNNIAYGVAIAPLDNVPDINAVRQAIAQGKIVPGIFPPNAYNIISKADTVPVMVMADGTQQNNGKLAELELAYRSSSGNIETIFVSGGMCQGDSGAPIYKAAKQADGSIYMSNVVLGVVVGFYPPTSVPGEGSFYNCSNGSINFTPLPNR